MSNNPALFRLKVSEQDAFSKPFHKVCEDCGKYTQYRFSHYRQTRGHKFAVYYCGRPECYGEHLAPVGALQ